MGYTSFQYKLFKTLHGVAPAYISNLLTRYPSTRPGLRSAGTNRLCVPPGKLKGNVINDRLGNSDCVPKLWNSLATYLPLSTNINDFRKNLKSYLFNKYFTC